MDLDVLSEDLEKIMRYTWRERDMPNALKCAELKLKHAQLLQNQNKNSNEPMSIDDLSEEQIISMINSFKE